MTLRQADLLEYWLLAAEGVTDVSVYDRTCDAVICYQGQRSAVIQALSSFSYESEQALALVPDRSGRELNREYENRLFSLVIRHYGERLLLPLPVRQVMAVVKSVKFILRGLRSLFSGEVKVELLDATAIVTSLIRSDFNTASSVMFLLELGDILEEWTHRKSVDSLARTMALNVDRAWRVEDGQEVLRPLSEISAGDRIVVRAGNVIPLDGTVVSGEATVNQASITGESLPVRKAEESTVYAGTVLEEGECTVLVASASGSGRYDRIVRMVEESEKLKSNVEARASHLADRLVPYSLGGAALTWLLTGNVTKAVSVLMVDFSCALKLSMPLAFLAAMRECGSRSITVKGGKFLEAVADADTIVFDKTGTLTHASPRMAEIVTFGGNDPSEMLRLAACLEEHFPHSIANAVVAEARERGLSHEEQHAKVNYVVAHGIASSIDGQPLVIGSHHFVFEDEHCLVPEGEQEKFDRLPDRYSHLYFAKNGVLAAVICIEDPIRTEAPAVIRQLHRLGITKTVMMTGDSERTARAVAREVGVDAYFSEVLPEDKAAFVRSEHDAGRKVIMIGDGINDSPALSEADVGIAVSSGAAIAREVADITISADDLREFVTLRRISTALMDRIHSNYRFIMTFNGLLIGLGVAGILPPALSALLHNGSTIGISLRSMTNLLPEQEKE